MGKQCWSQAVLESGSWGPSVSQTPALVIIIFYLFIYLFIFFFSFYLFFYALADDSHEMSSLHWKKLQNQV